MSRSTPSGNCLWSLRTWFVNFWTVSKKIPKGLSKLLSMSPEHRFERKKLSFSRNMFFACHSKLKLKPPGPSVKTFWVGCPNCILRVQKTFSWRKTVFGKVDSFFLHFGILNWNDWEFCWRNFLRVAKFAFD